MKISKVIIGIAVVGIAAIALAAPITQTAVAVNKNLPPSTRLEKMNDGIADVTTTDLPAVITRLNAVLTNTVIYAGSTNAAGLVVFATNTVIYVGP